MIRTDDFVKINLVNCSKEDLSDISNIFKIKIKDIYNVIKKHKANTIVIYDSQILAIKCDDSGDEYLVAYTTLDEKLYNINPINIDYKKESEKIDELLDKINRDGVGVLSKNDLKYLSVISDIYNNAYEDAYENLFKCLDVYNKSDNEIFELSMIYKFNYRTYRDIYNEYSDDVYRIYLIESKYCYKDYNYDPNFTYYIIGFSLYSNPTNIEYTMEIKDFFDCLPYFKIDEFYNFNLDDILDKINKHGIKSLTKREIDFLKNY